MFKSCQGLNSKCFLVTYLVIVGLLLTFWFNKTGLDYEELRSIPLDLKPAITSPPRSLEPLDGDYKQERALTSIRGGSHWKLVYFSHANCFPGCEKALKKVNQFQVAFGSKEVSTAIIGLDSEPKAQGKLASELVRRGYDFTVYESENEAFINELTRTFIALFLRTDFSDGQYQIEQKHDLFLLDPKGRVYAEFNEEVPFSQIQLQFVKIRQFYARTE